MTLRQLLAHTAGLSYNWFRGYGPGEPVPSLVQTLRGEAPANTPPVRPSLLPGLDCEITFEFTGGSPTMHIRQENSTFTAARRS